MGKTETLTNIDKLWVSFCLRLFQDFCRNWKTYSDCFLRMRTLVIVWTSTKPLRWLLKLLNNRSRTFIKSATLCRKGVFVRVGKRFVRPDGTVVPAGNAWLGSIEREVPLTGFSSVAFLRDVTSLQLDGMFNSDIMSGAIPGSPAKEFTLYFHFPVRFWIRLQYIW